ncbi:MAG: hypothetical protein KDE27_17345 [Planctomycetes bacterium]|nr:hypothetical protein [Planctomycetota bacterium]
MAVTGDRDNRGDEGDPPDHSQTPRRPPPVALRRVEGPVDGGDGPPPVRLVREYKGLTVADLERDEIVERLPGQVRSALHHLERGDLAAAERALPGAFAPLLPGPGADRPGRRPLRSTMLLWVVVTAALLGATLASYWF